LNIVSFASGNPFTRDIGHEIPVPERAQRADSRSEDHKKKPRVGFNDLLRDSSGSKRAAKPKDTTEPSDAQPRSESTKEKGDKAGVEKPEEAEQQAKATDASEKKAKDGSDKAESENAVAQTSAGKGEGEQEDAAGESQVQAAANAVSAELQASEKKQAQKAEAQQNKTQQASAKLVHEASTSGKASAKSQSNASATSVNAALPNQGTASTGPAVQSDAAATVQPVAPQGEAAQNNTNGEARSDSKSTTSNATTTTTSSTGANAAATTAFTVPDQAGSESRLPIHPTTATQSADAAKQAQVQTAVNTSDNDSLNTARLTRGLANAVQQRGGAVTLRLTPPEMGTVRIQMQITGTNVSASFHAESSSAQTLLTTQLAQLRTSLESKGMSVERLSVQPMASTTSPTRALDSSLIGAVGRPSRFTLRTARSVPGSEPMISASSSWPSSSEILISLASSIT